MSDHFTGEDEGKIGTIRTVEDARKAHHLATADPEFDGTLTGPAHEKKYGLDRHEGSAESWRAVGVHPYDNGALIEDDEPVVETAAAPSAPETADVSRPVV